MHTTNLRKVGGSVMLAVPPAARRLGSAARRESWPGGAKRSARRGAAAAASATHSKSCSPNVIGKRREGKEEREWLDDRPVGGELI